MAVRRFGVTLFCFPVTLGATPLRPTTHQIKNIMGNLNVILELTRGDLWVGRAEDGTRFAGRNVFDVARLVYAAGFTPLIQIHRNCCS